MSSSSQEDFSSFLLVLLVLAAVVAGLIYAFVWLLPYFTYYVLPFAAGSLIFGGIFWVAVRMEDSGIPNYKALAVIFPVIALAITVIFLVNSNRAFVYDAKSKQVIQVITDWPKVNEAFTKERRETYKTAPFESLRAKAKETVIYDRADLGFVLLWALMTGGPGLFWFLSRKDADTTRDKIEEIVNERTGKRWREISEREEKIKELVEQGQVSLRAEMDVLKNETLSLRKENQVLKARVEFAPQATVVKAGKDKKASGGGGGGILDGDVL